MTAEDFLEAFDLIAEAPMALTKVRALVLELAAFGRLTPAVAATIEGDAKAEQVPIGRGDQPAELPLGWRWVRVNELEPQFQNGASSRGDSDGIPVTVLRLADITNRRVQLSRTRALPIAADQIAKYRVQVGDVLITRVNGSADIVGTFVPIETDINAIYCDHFIRMRIDAEVIDPRYLTVVGATRHLRDQIRSLFITTAGQKTVNQGHIGGLTIPLPPLDDQKRIVEKVDELMALCDRLEAQQKEREKRHAALARASLTRFADAPTPANLNLLFHKSYSITPVDLRKAILALAIQGKLVPQDPNDEPAKELVARIAAKRRTSNSKEYDRVMPDEAPHEIPFAWSWVRLGDISLKSDSGWSPQCLPEARSGTDWGVLKVSAVSWGVFKPEENKALPKGIAGRPDCEVQPGDFLLSRANTEELVARSVVVDQAPPGLMMSDKIVRFTLPDEIDRGFINIANGSDASRAYYAQNASGTSSSMKNVGREVMCNLPIPLPPLAEQRRIVAMVDQLMALVDGLETQLAASRATAAKLLDVIVSELTA